MESAGRRVELLLSQLYSLPVLQSLVELLQSPVLPNTQVALISLRRLLHLPRSLRDLGCSQGSRWSGKSSRSINQVRYRVRVGRCCRVAALLWIPASQELCGVGITLNELRWLIGDGDQPTHACPGR
jgi:hypothetical protein